MKKVLLFAAVLGAISFTSCKKDHDCTCTSTSSGVELSKVTVTLEDLTSSEAEEACSTSVTVGTLTTACELD
ncbi:MAG: hypothetical protein ACJA0Q_000152 [Saprospiraceae bacterium]|jgi:hypothetical protein